MRLAYSVVIPAYNAERYIAQAVRSAVEQTVAPVDVVVVDDGSSDATVDVARAAGATVVTQRNAGPSAARNRGVAATRTPLVAFLDADDWWLPTKAERQLPTFDDPDTGLSHTYFRDTSDAEILVPYAGDIYHDLLRACVVGVLTVMMRRDLFDSLGGFDEGLRAAEDWDCWLRAARRTRVAVVPEVLACYRVHDMQSSGDDATLLASATRMLDRQRPAFDCPECWSAYRQGRRTARTMYGTRMLHRRDERYPLRQIAAASPQLLTQTAFWRVTARRALARVRS